MPNLQHMKKDSTGTSFLKNSGNGIGPQIVVHHSGMSDPANPAPLEKGSGKGRKTKLAAFGLSPSIIAQGDPEYAVMLNQANKWRKMRMKELREAHGHVGVGVGTLVASAALCQAASRYLFQRASTAGAEGIGEDLKLAAKLSTDGRQNDLAAWEMCAKEGLVRKRLSQSTSLAPWEVTPSGDERQKPGRKTNLERSGSVVTMEADGTASEETEDDV